MPFSKELYHERKNYIIDYLGGKCEICKSENNLEFDHITDEHKVACVTELLHHGLDVAIKEADKCRLLCSDCHNDTKFFVPDHGTLARYSHNTLKCRCDKCKAANAKCMREYRKRKKSRGISSVG